MKLEYDGKEFFRICQLTDIHLGPCPLNDPSKKTLESIDSLLSVNKFNLIIITGDIIWGKLINEPQKTIGELAQVLNRHKIPVAFTYGNHDTEGDFGRQDLRGLEKLFTNLAPKYNSKIIDDRENYTLEVYKEGILMNVLYVWDSGAYSYLTGEKEYACIDNKQINWFNKLPYTRNKGNIDLGFLHIPLPEYGSAKNIFQGEKNEEICSPKVNSGLFYNLLIKGNVKAVFAGHDHDNNFVANYKGVKLAYGNVTGYNTYGSLPRGCRIIDIYENKVNSQIAYF